MSCGILMPKYVITALLHILYGTRNWCGVGVIMLKKTQFFSVNITEFRATNILALYDRKSDPEAKVIPEPNRPFSSCINLT